LIELFYNLYNPETIEKKELKIAQEWSIRKANPKNPKSSK
jgi:hypothetical protein